MSKLCNDILDHCILGKDMHRSAVQISSHAHQSSHRFLQGQTPDLEHCGTKESGWFKQIRIKDDLLWICSRMSTSTVIKPKDFETLFPSRKFYNFGGIVVGIRIPDTTLIKKSIGKRIQTLYLRLSVHRRKLKDGFFAINQKISRD